MADPERAPLLQNGAAPVSPNDVQDLDEVARKKQAAVGGILTVIVIGALVTIIAFFGGDDISEKWTMRGKPIDAAHRVLLKSPVIDGHIDLPELVRMFFANNASAVNLDTPVQGHVDIPRLRRGQVGGFFWSVYVDCKEDGVNHTTATYRVRDTLEQIDISKALIERHPNTFQFALGTADARDAMRSGRIASWLGVEGAHQLGNSLSVLRQYYALGVRYMTLTHSCNNAFADSAGISVPLPPAQWGGLNPTFGVELIKEMNRLGMIIDLSHTSDQTVLDTLKITQAPVIWSHSSSRTVNNHPRNVPDHILSLLSDKHEKGKVDGVVMVNFAPDFVSPGGKGANVYVVADHVEQIAKVAGKKHVGIGSDYDGIFNTPVGLEDVSKYPNLFAELIKRGWSSTDLHGLAGGNLLRVFQKIEAVGRRLRDEGAQPSYLLYDRRDDLPVKWRPGS